MMRLLYHTIALFSTVLDKGLLFIRKIFKTRRKLLDSQRVLYRIESQILIGLSTTAMKSDGYKSGIFTTGFS